MKKYKITITKEQLTLLNEATNILSRVKMGQFDEFLTTLRDKDNNLIFDHDLLDDVNKLIKPKMGLEGGQSFGVNRFDDADKLFTLHNCFRHQLWKENPNRSNATVDSHVTDWGGGLIEIEEIEDEPQIKQF